MEKKIFSFRIKTRHVLNVGLITDPGNHLFNGFEIQHMSILNSSLNIYIVFTSLDKLIVQIQHTPQTTVSKMKYSCSESNCLITVQIDTFTVIFHKRLL